MGYYTSFSGEFYFDKPVTDEHQAVFDELINTDSDAFKLSAAEVKTRLAGGWCPWVLEKDFGDEYGVHCPESCKAYEFEYWLLYIVENFAKPFGYTLTGLVSWYGEDNSDMGRVEIRDNELRVMKAVVTYPKWGDVQPLAFQTP